MARLEETCFICQPTVFLRRELVERVGYLDESLRYCMDYDLWIRLARVAPFAFTPHYLATTRLHADTKTLGQRVPAHAEILRMVRRHFGHVPPSWVYAYAHAVLGPRDRREALGGRALRRGPHRREPRRSSSVTTGASPWRSGARWGAGSATGGGGVREHAR